MYIRIQYTIYCIHYIGNKQPLVETSTSELGPKNTFWKMTETSLTQIISEEQFKGVLEKSKSAKQ